MKKLLATTVLALSFAGVGASAYAANTPLTFSSGGTTGAGYVGAAYNASTTFNTTYSFSTSTAFDFTAYASSVPGVSLSSLTLKDTTTGATATYHSSSSTTPFGNAYSFNLSNLAAGSYTLTIAGTAAYSAYSITYAVRAVPEATTTSMMLGGLALVGMVAWRRRRKDQQGKQSISYAMTAA